MYTVFQIAQLVLAIILIGLVLIQQGKGATAGAGFGGGAGASGTVFGARGSAGFLTRLTGILAAVFFVLCIAMAWLVNSENKGTGSVLDRVEAPVAVDRGEVPSIDVELDAAPAASTEVPAAE